MRINPISPYATQYLSFKSETLIRKHAEQKAQIPFDGYKKQTVVYPRRYLPQDYPQTETKKMTYDSFTGLRDKNYLLTVINSAMRRHNGKTLSIAMFDMDNFKSVNELLGYQTGDNFIKAISQNVSNVAKQNSINAYRFGGEEFVIVFDGQPKDKQKDIVEEIIRQINSDSYLQSRAGEYRENAQKKLEEYNLMHTKVDSLIPLKTKQSLFSELRENFETEEAKNDPYLIKSINETNSELKRLYLGLIDERLSDESESSETKQKLKDIKRVYEREGKLPKKQNDELDEYLISVYDKTFEIHQIKKWISEFDKNHGFSITGGVVHFSPSSMRNKTSLDIVNEAGEILKSGKGQQKGQGYYTQIQ